jgi:Fe2+ or Zn2+ uptake regulation protein
MKKVSTSLIARAILLYLQKNPDAQDTLAGITEWWLPKQMTVKTATVKEALALLIADELILEVKGKDAQSHYRLNDRKRNEIEALFDS